MDEVGLIKLCEKVRRDFPRNEDLLTLCTAVERYVAGWRNREAVEAKPKEKVDRTVYHRNYMREYMRELRAKQKEGK